MSTGYKSVAVHFVVSLLVLTVPFSSGCLGQRAPDRTVAVSTWDTKASGLVSITYTVDGLAIIDESTRVNLRGGRESQDVYTADRLPGPGNLTVTWMGDDDRNMTWKWPNWKPGYYPNHLFVSISSREVRVIAPTP